MRPPSTPSPLPPLSGPADLESYVCFDEHGALLQVPARDFRMQSLAVLFLLPLLAVLIGLAIALSTTGDLGLAFGALVAVGGSGLGGLGGIVGLLRAPGKSRATRVVLHSDRRIEGPGLSVAPGELVALRVGQPNRLLKWIGIIGQRHDGTEVVLLGRLPPGRGRTVAALGDWLGQALSVPADTTVARTGMGMKPEHAAGLCYMPIQGLGIMYSVYSLVVSGDPLVRFSAKQSLSFQLLTGGIAATFIFGAIGLAVVGERLGMDRAAGGLVFVLAAVVAAFFALLRLVLLIVAGVKALSGKAWPMPVFGILSRRWLPPEL